MTTKNLSAEESILGAMMWSRSIATLVVQLLKPTDFWDAKHRLIYDVLSDLATAGEMTDARSLVAELEKRGTLERAGNKDYVYLLLDTCPNEGAWKHYCECILDAAARREISNVGPRLQELGYGQDVKEALDTASQELHEIGARLDHNGPSHVSEGVYDSFDRMMKARETGSRVTGLPTGFNELDMTTGGLQPGNLLIVGGRTSMGKTSWSLNIAHYVALHMQQPVLIFSLEMSARDISERLVCQEAKTNLSLYRVGDLNDDEMRRVQAAKTRVANAPITIDDSGNLTLEQARMTTRQVRPALVIVDYLQLLYSSEKVESRAQQVSQFARDLKALAMELQIPVIAASQLRRLPAGSTPKEPSLEDLKESGGIEQNADLVVLLYRPAVDKPRDDDLRGKADMHLAKHRNGRTGKFRLWWAGASTTFLNPDSDEAVMSCASEEKTSATEGR